MDGCHTDWSRYNFFRPPHWRWLRARDRLHSQRPRDKSIDDPWVDAAMRVIALPAARGTPASRDVAAALALWTADEVPRWLLEAQLLTGRAFDAVAEACSLEVDSIPEPIVRAYHEVFFDIVPKIKAQDWVLARAIGCGPLNNFAGRQPAGVWKYLGYFGGPVALDMAVAVTLDRPLPACPGVARPPRSPLDERLTRFKVKLALATLTAESHHLGSVVRLLRKLHKLEERAGLRLPWEYPVPAFYADLYSLQASAARRTPASGRTPGRGGVDPAAPPGVEPGATEGGPRPRKARGVQLGLYSLKELKLDFDLLRHMFYESVSPAPPEGRSRR